MRGKTKNNKISPKAKSVIQKAAEAAAEEVVSELDTGFTAEEEVEDRPDVLDMQSADDEFESSSAEEVQNKDIFRDAWTKAQKKNDVPQYYIYKNGTWIANKPHPYSWERLQKEYGEGHYRIVAKSTVNGQNILIQSQLVGNPHEEEVETHQDAEALRPQGPDPLAFLTMMAQMQDKAESKAQTIAAQQMQMFGQMMQSMTQMQVQSQQQMQMMMMELQKQQQSVAQESNKLLITLLTQKPQSTDQGIKMFDVLKLVKDAEKDAEQRAKNMYEMVDKKAEALAELKAEAIAGGDDSEESTMKTIIKGFVPVVAQALAQGQQPQAQAQPQRVPVQQPGPINGPLKPAIPAPQQMRREAPIQKPPQANPVGIDPAVALKERKAKEEAEKIRKQEQVLGLVGVDIADALINRVPAREVTEGILQKLEKSGYSRQNVARLFTLEDFYGHARRLGIPTEADPWLKEFHETIEQHSKPGAPTPSTPEVLPAEPKHGKTGKSVRQVRAREVTPNI